MIHVGVVENRSGEVYYLLEDTQWQKERTNQKGSSKPNILVIWGDDIGISNLSCYSHGVMGYQTPNIDRLVAANHLTPASILPGQRTSIIEIISS